MGAGNVAAAYARWAWLPDASFRALVYMANTSLDGDEEPRYWGGRDALAHALGYVDLPKPPSKEATLGDPVTAATALRERDRAFRAVVRALQRLVDAGVVARVSGGVNGHNTVYALRLLAERHGRAQGMTRKLAAGQTDTIKRANRAARGAAKGDTRCPPDNSEQATPGVTQEDTGCPPGSRTPGVPLRATPGVVPGRHPVSSQEDTGCHPKEEEEEEGTEKEQLLGELISHLGSVAVEPPDDDLDPLTSETSDHPAPCPHGVRGGLHLTARGRIRCIACRRTTAVSA